MGISMYGFDENATYPKVAVLGGYKRTGDSVAPLVFVKWYGYGANLTVQVKSSVQ